MKALRLFRAGFEALGCERSAETLEPKLRWNSRFSLVNLFVKDFRSSIWRLRALAGALIQLRCCSRVISHRPSSPSLPATSQIDLSLQIAPTAASSLLQHGFPNGPVTESLEQPQAFLDRQAATATIQISPRPAQIVQRCRTSSRSATAAGISKASFWWIRGGSAAASDPTSLRSVPPVLTLPVRMETPNSTAPPARFPELKANEFFITGTHDEHDEKPSSQHVTAKLEAVRRKVELRAAANSESHGC